MTDYPDLSDEPYGVEDLDPIGGRVFTIGITPTESDEFRRYVFAAAKTLRMGNRSVDYMLREYGDRWNLGDHERDRSITVLGATRAVRQETRSAIVRLVRCPDKPGRLGLFAALAALGRLHSTFRALTFTVRHGFRFESAALLRLVVEQLAWALAVCERDDHGIFAVLPQSSLRSLVALIPDAGRLYGSLSQRAHIHPDETLKYIEFHDMEPYIRMNFRDRNDDDVLYMLQVADYYIAVCEVVGAELPVPRYATEVVDGHTRVREARPFGDVVRRYTAALARAPMTDPGGV